MARISVKVLFSFAANYDIAMPGTSMDLEPILSGLQDGTRDVRGLPQTVRFRHSNEIYRKLCARPRIARYHRCPMGFTLITM